jgi:probable HAF family extracellular repeat protein
MLYSNGSFQELGTLGGISSYARDINNNGQIVGYASDIYENNKAFLYSNGSMISIGDLGGSTSSASAINDAGAVVGTARTANGFNHAFLYENGATKDIGSLGVSSSASDINSFDQVVGSYCPYSACISGNSRAFIYTAGNMLDLNTLIDPSSGWVLLSASSINDAGQVAGVGYLNGVQHAFVMSIVPVPEPASYALFLAGLGLIGVRTRDRRAR